MQALFVADEGCLLLGHYSPVLIGSTIIKAAQGHPFGMSYAALHVFPDGKGLLHHHLLCLAVAHTNDV